VGWLRLYAMSLKRHLEAVKNLRRLKQTNYQNPKKIRQRTGRAIPSTGTDYGVKVIGPERNRSVVRKNKRILCSITLRAVEAIRTGGFRKAAAPKAEHSHGKTMRDEADINKSP